MEPNFEFSLLLIISLWLLLTFHSNAETSTYIIHMNKSFFPQVFTNHHDWFKSTIHSLKSKTLVLDDHDQQEASKQSQKKLVYTYDNAMYGFCAMLSSNELEIIKNIDGFVSAYQDRTATIDTTHTFEFLSLDSPSGLWHASNFGDDIIVGVIDSGVWPESQSFKDDGMTKKIPNKWKGTCETGHKFNASVCNFKLIGARSFNKGVIAGNYRNVGISKNSARDSIGHGTHTSSTVAGNYVNGASYFGYAKGVARGIAPKAKIAMYKVIWEEDVMASDVLAGMDQAIIDGVDVISISIGIDGIPLYEDAIAIASFTAMEKGIVVSSSAGNSGPKHGTLHNGIPWVLTVAAGTTDRTFGSLVLGNGLVYDCTPQDYVNFLCGLKFTKRQILTITRSSSHGCENTSLDLNYPSFIAFYNKKTRSMVHTFNRTVTNVGDGAATYSAKVTQPKGCVVRVLPEILTFSYRNEKQSYYIIIKCDMYKKKYVSFGDLVWIEDGGVHTVRSPIVVAPTGII
uniref:Proteinase inhibitor I9, subtilisin propeptide n=1 Tax=Medicago truncatula TaxID=3880 RepID=A2Q1Q3_MEDTR|nr:Proteinase inhibitor I9, subtilisin propeptide [Medicago truncatula]